MFFCTIKHRKTIYFISAKNKIFFFSEMSKYFFFINMNVLHHIPIRYSKLNLHLLTAIGLGMYWRYWIFILDDAISGFIDSTCDANLIVEHDNKFLDFQLLLLHNRREKILQKVKQYLKTWTKTPFYILSCIVAMFVR